VSAPRRALFVSNLFPSSTEPGRGLFNLDQLHALREIGLDSTVVAPRPWFPGWRTRATAAAPFPPYREEVKGFRVVHPRALYLPLSRSALNATLYRWSVARACRQAARQFNPDFLWASFAFPDGVGCAGIARKLRLPLVISVLGSDVNVSFGLPRRRRAMLAAFQEARLVLTKSARLRTELSEAGVDRTPIVLDYNGVDDRLFHPVPIEVACRELGVEPRQRLLFVGNLVPIKGLLDLFQAWRTVVEHCDADPPELVLVGEGRLRASLRSQAQALQMESTIRFVGRQPRERVALWMAASTGLVLPSHNEGVPNVILEALACGRPVVATNVGGVAEVHPGDAAGFIVPPSDPPALAQAIRCIIQRPWDGQRLRALVARWTWGANAQTVIRALGGAPTVGSPAPHCEDAA
jgi:glycosyltransferase involved in cell wall biosynthesis